MSLAAIIAKQVAKAGSELVDFSTVEKTVRTKVEPLVERYEISGKDKEEYVARMTKALADGDGSFKSDPVFDPDEALLFAFDDVVSSAKAAAKTVKEEDVTRSVMPAPQRFFDPEDKDFKPFLGDMGEQAGGRYLEMGGGPPRDITGEYPAQAVIGVTPEGKPIMQVSEALLDGEVRTDGRKIKTNLFKKKAGWKWTQVPEGFDPDPPSNFPLVSVEDGKQHYYALRTEFPEGVELSRYEKSKTEPRLRPTKKGNVHLGTKVGEITVRGKKHPVYDQIKVYGLLGASTTIMQEEREEFSEGGVVGFFKKMIAAMPQEESRVMVNKGDTLGKISKETGVSVKELQEYNNIKDPNKIQTGQTLRLEPEGKKLSAIRKEAVRQSRETLEGIEQAIGNFGKFQMGNILGGDPKGDDIDVGTLGQKQQQVLKQAMVNAEKEGRQYVTYDDYPAMADGQSVRDFYDQKRSDADLVNLARASFSDPVFEMFTSLGAFNFSKDDAGNFEVLPDRYDFDKAKSTASDRANPKDDYARLTYLGQDISEDEDAYGFNFKGRLDVAKGGRVDKDKMACNKPRRTPNHPKKSHVVKACEDGKEKIIRFGEQGAKTAGKPKAGESARMKAKRKSFKARHRRNIKKGKMSAAYWADKTKW